MRSSCDLLSLCHLRSACRKLSHVLARLTTFVYPRETQRLSSFYSSNASLAGSDSRGAYSAASSLRAVRLIQELSSPSRLRSYSAGPGGHLCFMSSSLFLPPPPVHSPFPLLHTRRNTFAASGWRRIRHSIASLIRRFWCDHPAPPPADSLRLRRLACRVPHPRVTGGHQPLPAQSARCMALPGGCGGVRVGRGAWGEGKESLICRDALSESGFSLTSCYGIAGGDASSPGSGRR